MKKSLRKARRVSVPAGLVAGLAAAVLAPAGPLAAVAAFSLGVGLGGALTVGGAARALRVRVDARGYLAALGAGFVAGGAVRGLCGPTRRRLPRAFPAPPRAPPRPLPQAADARAPTLRIEPLEAAQILMNLAPIRRMDVLRHADPRAPLVQRAYRDVAVGQDHGWERLVRVILRHDHLSLFALAAVALSPPLPTPAGYVDLWAEAVRRMGN